MAYRFSYREGPDDTPFFRGFAYPGEWDGLVSLAREFLPHGARDEASDAEALVEPTFDVDAAAEQLLGKDHPITEQSLAALADPGEQVELWRRIRSHSAHVRWQLIQRTKEVRSKY